MTSPRRWRRPMRCRPTSSRPPKKPWARNSRAPPSIRMEESMSNPDQVNPELLKLHEAAEAEHKTFKYVKPDAVGSAKGLISLGNHDIVRGTVQDVKKP